MTVTTSSAGSAAARASSVIEAASNHPLHNTVLLVTHISPFLNLEEVVNISRINKICRGAVQWAAEKKFCEKQINAYVLRLLVSYKQASGQGTFFFFRGECSEPTWIEALLIEAFGQRRITLLTHVFRPAEDQSKQRHNLREAFVQGSKEGDLTVVKGFSESTELCELINLSPIANNQAALTSAFFASAFVLGMTFGGSEPKATLFQALELAAQNGKIEVVKFLLKFAADDQKTVDCAFRSAVAGGHQDLIDELEDRASSNVRADALRLAAHGGHVAIVKQRLESASPTQRAEAASLAALRGHMDVVPLLVEDCPVAQEAAFLGAASGGHVAIIDMLLSRVSPRTQDLAFCRAVKEAFGGLERDRYKAIVTKLSSLVSQRERNEALDVVIERGFAGVGITVMSRAHPVATLRDCKEDISTCKDITEQLISATLSHGLGISPEWLDALEKAHRVASIRRDLDLAGLLFPYLREASQIRIRAIQFPSQLASGAHHYLLELKRKSLTTLTDNLDAVLAITTAIFIAYCWHNYNGTNSNAK